MYTITKQKVLEEIEQSLEGKKRVYIVGCGTCATMCHTGGKAEVLEMKQKLEEMDKIVTGWMVIPTACDSLTKEALAEEAEAISKADALLVMTCAFGVQMVARHGNRVVIPALDTLFLGMEDLPGSFSEVCTQCGDCVLAWTGGICPVTACPKGLLDGPCGGSKEGKCEVDPSKDCAWVLIYQKLKSEGRLDEMRKYRGPKNYLLMTRPRKYVCHEKTAEDL
jgi:ferredoxin